MNKRPPAEWLARPPGYELFFIPLGPVLGPTEQELLHFAYVASKYGHRGQFRDGGSRYFDHPKAAAWIYISELDGRDVRLIADLLLHDIPEDCYLISPYRMKLNFGEDIALDVAAMTKLSRGKETTREYLKRIIDRGPWAITAKLCDRLHNVRTLKTCVLKKRQEQIRETSEHHLKLLIPALKKHGGEWEVYAKKLKEKIQEALAFYENN